MLLGKIRNMSKIRKMAKSMGINTHRMKKTGIIRAIQRKENNIDCYGTPRVEYCHEPTCLWREDCLSQNEKTKSIPQ